ncbi:MAG: C13 family peptidase [Deltaproteobacteria bacterium]|nr:C13 family peptidase [Deltaproteobacteria bacterium]
MYLYVSSHGLPPLLRWKAGVREPAELGAHLELRRGEVGTFDRHAIGLEAGDGPGLGQVEDMLEAHRQGATPEDIVFTPDTLAGVLETLPEATPAIVVLQACFSGGFIGRPDDDGPSPLTRRPHTTILTATSSRRPSFGCSPGSHRTYYGGAFNRVLAQKLEEAPRLPPELPWDDIHQRVRFVVETMEFIDGETPSEPSFFSSDAPSSTNTAASASPSKPAADSTPSTH